MFKKLIEKLYLNQEENLVYYDKFFGVKTENYFKMVAKDLYKKSICKVILISVNNVEKMNKEYGYDDARTYIRDNIRTVAYKKGIKDICMISNNKFVIIADTNFDIVENISKNENLMYGYVNKKENDELIDSIKKTYVYMKKRRSNERKKKNKR